ncbi:hypothetical protein LACWKB8_1129 [Lactobacillus sp. wkB8]|uniref:hypothetical protein n=1 Tax=Lactobacillus sp. wkB8 TaxID=1545702 RepID=UPI00050D1D2F|nr:hypothetical protein [Lactobacillus sp. wkB8]AIS09399.1 hypothetical protein LACWKB8_1129 [Lactobacillus sp. wkB8]
MKKLIKIILSVSVIAGLGFSTVQAAFNTSFTNTNQYSKRKLHGGHVPEDVILV